MLVIETITRWEMMGSPWIVDLGKTRANSDLGFPASLEFSFNLNSQFAQPAI